MTNPHAPNVTIESDERLARLVSSALDRPPGVDDIEAMWARVATATESRPRRRRSLRIQRRLVPALGAVCMAAAISVGIAIAPEDASVPGPETASAREVLMAAADARARHAQVFRLPASGEYLYVRSTYVTSPREDGTIVPTVTLESWAGIDGRGRFVRIERLPRNVDEDTLWKYDHDSGVSSSLHDNIGIRLVPDGRGGWTYEEVKLPAAQRTRISEKLFGPGGSWNSHLNGDAGSLAFSPMASTNPIANWRMAFDGAELSDLPSTPGAFERAILAGVTRLSGGTSHDRAFTSEEQQQMRQSLAFDLVVELLAEAPLTADQSRAAFDYLASLEGARVDGTTQDRRGRTGTHITFESPNNGGAVPYANRSLLIDPDTGLLLQESINGGRDVQLWDNRTVTRTLRSNQEPIIERELARWHQLPKLPAANDATDG